MQPAKTHNLASIPAPLVVGTTPMYPIRSPGPRASVPSAAIQMEKDGFVAAASLLTILSADTPLTYSISSKEQRTKVEVTNPQIKERKQRVSSIHEMPADCRISIPIPSSLGRDTQEIVADAMIQGMQLTLSLEEGRKGNAILSLLSGNFELSSCKFSFGDGTLHLYSFHTHPYYRRKGLSTSLQRMAHLIAGRPDEVVIHQIMHTNPAYKEISEEFLNSGTMRKFHPGMLKASIERMLEGRVSSLELLNDTQLNESGLKLVRRNGFYNVGLKNGTTFDLAISLFSELSAV